MSNKQYPSNLYLESAATNIDFAKQLSVEAVVVMAKELLALRKAFSEPFCCTTSHEVEHMQRGDGGSMWNMEAFDEGDVLLYRKPE